MHRTAAYTQNNNNSNENTVQNTIFAGRNVRLSNLDLVDYVVSFTYFFFFFAFWQQQNVVAAEIIAQEKRQTNFSISVKYERHILNELYVTDVGGWYVRASDIVILDRRNEHFHYSSVLHITSAIA